MSNEFEQKSTWNETGNQKRILRRIGLDALSGSLAALSVAPMIFMIDKAIVQKASGTMTLRQSFKDSCISLFKHPGRFILKREFLLVMFVYGSTYTAANAIDSLCKIYNVSDSKIVNNSSLICETLEEFSNINDIFLPFHSFILRMYGL